jgi:hypothetical protein
MQGNRGLSRPFRLVLTGEIVGGAATRNVAASRRARNGSGFPPRSLLDDYGGSE